METRARNSLLTVLFDAFILGFLVSAPAAAQTASTPLYLDPSQPIQVRTELDSAGVALTYTTWFSMP